MSTSALKVKRNLLISLALGIGATVLLFVEGVDHKAFEGFQWNGSMFLWISIALLFVFGRDFGLAWRFHTIAKPVLSWKRSFRTELMCAFTSAVTPSAMGGSAFAIFYLNREGVKLGNATTMTLTTLFLDELFYVVFCPLIIWLIPLSDLFGAESLHNDFLRGVEIVFWLVYAGIVVWTTILFWGIILKPHLVARMIDFIFRWKVLRRWSAGAHEMGMNMIETSKAVRKASFRWWANVFGATVLSWFSRFLVVCALFKGFVPDASELIVFGRQFVVWVVLMVSPTPGGSGISEWLFSEYYGDLIGSVGIALILAVIWRLITYYIYLIAGAVIIPTYFSKLNQSDKSNAISK